MIRLLFHWFLLYTAVGTTSILFSIGSVNLSFLSLSCNLANTHNGSKKWPVKVASGFKEDVELPSRRQSVVKGIAS